MKIYVYGEMSPLLMDGDWVVNGAWRVHKEGEEMWTDKKKTHRLYFLMDAPKGCDYNEIINKALETVGKVCLLVVFPGYILKHDGIRKTHRWTAIGPGGRIGDYQTDKEGYDAIKKEKDSSG